MAPNATAFTEALPVNAPVRYQGSVEEFSGLVGFVEATYGWQGEIRHSITLTVGDSQPVKRLVLVRRESLVALPEGR